MPRKSSLSLDLLQTFLTLLRHDGDAAAAGRELNINQPSMSKRLGFFQHAGAKRILTRPWLVREGKTWRPTPEGDRVRPAVEDIVRRYEALWEFVDRPLDRPQVAFACGQHASQTFVPRAVVLFGKKHPDVLVRLSTPRGQARIEGVANGAFDLAVVSHEADAIKEIASRQMYIKSLHPDPLALVSAKGMPWSAAVEALADGKAKPRDVAELPLILPERDSGVRRSFDKMMGAKVMAGLRVAMEVGGWTTILSLAKEGIGVGLVSAMAARLYPEKGLIVRQLDRKAFPPRHYQLIARRGPGSADGPPQPELSDEARAFHDILLEVANEGAEA